MSKRNQRDSVGLGESTRTDLTSPSDRENIRWMTLHDLTRRFSTPAVANVLGVSESTLEQKRCGRRPLTLVELWTLYEAYPKLDLVETVRVLADKRRAKVGVR